MKMAKWLKDLFNEYLTESLEEDAMSSSNATPVIGGVYFGSLRSLNENNPNKPLWFVIVDKVDDNLYEVFKITDWWQFATNRDIIINIGTMKIMVEVSNNFYLNEDEIKRFVLIHKLSSQDVQDILAFRDGEEPSRPLRVGVTPIYREDIRNQFNETEFRMIEDLHLRVFAILQDPEEGLGEEPFEDEWIEPIEEKWLYPPIS